MAYSDKLIEHYNNPQNVGTFDKEAKKRRYRVGRSPRVRRRYALQIEVDDANGNDQ